MFIFVSRLTSTAKSHSKLNMNVDDENKTNATIINKQIKASVKSCEDNEEKKIYFCRRVEYLINFN